MHPSSLFVLLSATASLVAAKTTTTIDKAEASCSAALDDYVDGIPTVPTKLMDAVATNTNLRPQETGDVCNIAWPSEVQSDIRDYGSSVLAWYSSHEQSISTLFSQCPEAKAYGYVSSCADLWATYSAVPNSASATATATGTHTKSSASKTASKTKGSATPTSSTDDDASTTSSESSATTPASSSTFTTATTSASTAGAASSSTQGGAAPKETGMRIAAVAVAGLVAAAAAL
ncbi:unnamed protein product [Clonostachys rosea]|uniref:DUF7735 domain-containing protein n=1 Tax=Bionectria ochroleuca TaxID=29856 RepID=A0ABY6U8M1_BIOOC|nr:unnamed protein product [Clonostachys rosea]